MTVKEKQHLLAYLGYYVGDVDNEWGTLSKTACKAFQQDYFQMDSKVDGICGTETEKALKHAVCYGMPAKKQEVLVSGDFWDDIKYWSREEFRCQCGGKYCSGYPAEPDQTLVELVDTLRHKAGRPGHRSSGLRCATWNTIQGGVANSKHMTGKALDFFIEGLSGNQLLAMAQSDPRTSYAYIIDGQYVHVDVK